MRGRNEKIPGWWVWFHYLSSFKYALEGLLINQFDYSVECEFFVPEGVVINQPCIETSEDILEGEYNVSINNKWLNLVILLGFSIFFRILAYFLLWLTHRYNIHGRN